MRLRVRAGTLLVDDGAAAEAVEREGGVEWVRRVLGDGPGEHPARSRRRLEAAVAPAAVEIKILDRRFADDRAAVHGHVHDAGPAAHQAQAREAREHGEPAFDRVLNRRQVSPLSVGIVEVEVAAHHQLALVGLADIEVSGTEGDDGIEHGFERLAHESLQHMSLDRQAQAGARGPPAGGAGGGAADLGPRAEAGPGGRGPRAGGAGGGEADLARRDEAARGLDPAYAPVLDAEAGDLTILDDIDAALVRRAGVTPGDRVVARSPAARLQQAADDRASRVIGTIEERHHA